MLFPRTSPIIVILAWAVGCSTPPPPTAPVTSAPEFQPATPPPPPEVEEPAPKPATALPPRPAPPPPKPPKPEPRALEPAAEAVVARLAAQLRIPAAQIEVVQVSRADWPDSCLGLAAEGEICSTVVTPGFAVSVSVSGQRYEFRTDASGQRIRVAAAPLAELREPLLNWRDSQSFTVLNIGAERAAYGLRGRPLLKLPRPLDRRMEQLMLLLGKYAPFQARTSAGEVNFRGTGSATATAAEQRMVAEWAGLVAAEVGQGRTTPTPDRALAWERTGGVAGFCDRLVVGRSGFASAWSCRGGEEKLIATTTLASDELALLYDWLDHLEAFSWSSEDAEAAADGMTISLEVNSAGLNPAGESERQQMLDLIDSLVNRMLTASGVTPSGR